MSVPNQDGLKIAAALLAKNIGGGINYMAVCSCLNASPESIAAGLCVDNVMALVYFPLVSVLASKYKDVVDENDDVVEEGKRTTKILSGFCKESASCRAEFEWINLKLRGKKWITYLKINFISVLSPSH